MAINRDSHMSSIRARRATMHKGCDDGLSACIAFAGLQE